MDEIIDEASVSMDELMTEVRRAGRAAVAARAAAEACEESVERLEAGKGSTEPAGETDGRDVVEALLPVCDALGRMAEAAREPQRELGWFERLRRAEETAAELRALREAIVLVDAQLTSALEIAGVAVDLRVGGPVDPDRHRVVETVPRGDGPGGVVVKIARPGYALGERRIRDADVVATV